MSTILGCGNGDDSEVVQPEADSANEDGKSATDAPPNLLGSFKVFDEEKGGWVVAEKLDDWTPTGVTGFIDKVFEAPETPPSQVLLTRNEDVFNVRKNRDGKLTLGVTTKVDDEWFEANEYEDVTAESSKKVFEAFVKGDESIRTAIEWDEIVE